MNAGRLPPAREPSRFHATVWSRIERARAGASSERNLLYWQYRRPVLTFLESRLPKGLDAEAVADDVMCDVLSTDFLRHADQSRGRFRDLLLAVTRNQLSKAIRMERAEKRGGKRRRVDVEELNALAAPSEGERRDFDSLYAREVMDAAIERFREACRARGSLEAEALFLFYMQGLSQNEVADRLGRPQESVNTWVHTGRKKLREHILSVLREVCSSEEELQSEARYLVGLIGSSKA